MFLNKEEQLLNNEFKEKGFLIRDSYDHDSLEIIKQTFVDDLKKKFQIKDSNQDILNNFHKYIELKDLNNYRLELIEKINSTEGFRLNYFNTAKKLLYSIVGNELVMQNRINLSIQLPGDESSLLPIHSDTWSGDSPYEVVVWLPIVDCYSTKSMYILPPKYKNEINVYFQEKTNATSDEIYEAIKDKVEWINIKYGEVLIFNQNLPHGNIINRETETRWTMNCRFKSVFSPYGDKKIGEFFEPITLRSVSEIGMKYKYPNEK